MFVPHIIEILIDSPCPKKSPIKHILLNENEPYLYMYMNSVS